MSIRRSGATVILTYYAKEAGLALASRAEIVRNEAARWLQEDA